MCSGEDWKQGRKKWMALGTEYYKILLQQCIHFSLMLILTFYLKILNYSPSYWTMFCVDFSALCTIILFRKTNPHVSSQSLQPIQTAKARRNGGTETRVSTGHGQWTSHGAISVKIAYYVNWHMVDLRVIFVCLFWGLACALRLCQAWVGGISHGEGE